MKNYVCGNRAKKIVLIPAVFLLLLFLTPSLSHATNGIGAGSIKLGGYNYTFGLGGSTADNVNANWSIASGFNQYFCQAETGGTTTLSLVKYPGAGSIPLFLSTYQSAYSTPNDMYVFGGQISGINNPNTCKMKPGGSGGYGFAGGWDLGTNDTYNNLTITNITSASGATMSVNFSFTTSGSNQTIALSTSFRNTAGAINSGFYGSSALISSVSSGNRSIGNSADCYWNDGNPDQIDAGSANNINDNLIICNVATAGKYWILINTTRGSGTTGVTGGYGLVFSPMFATTLNLYLNGQLDANTTITYGTQSNFTCTINNGNYCRVYLNGTAVNSYVKNQNIYLKSYYSAGIYKVIAGTNTSGVSNVTYSNVTYYETIIKANALNLTAPSNFTYDGTKLNFTAKMNEIGSQIHGNFSVNSYKSGLTSSGQNSYLNGTAGTYTALFNTSGNQNYTVQSLKLVRKISQAAPTSTFYVNSNLAGTNSTAFTTEPIPLKSETDVLNSLVYKVYSVYPNGTVSLFKSFTPTTGTNTSLFTYIQNSLMASGKYVFYINTSGNINYSTYGSKFTAVVLNVPYPTLSLQYTSVFSNQNNTFSFASAFNSSNLLYLQVNKVSNTTLLLNSSYVGSPSYKANFSYVYVGNYSVRVVDTYTNLSTVKYYTIVAVSLFQCSSSSSITVPAGGHIGKVFNLTVFSALNRKKVVNLSSAAGSMQVIGSNQVSTGTALGYTNATNLKDADFQICLLAGAGSSLNMNGTSSSIFYTNIYNITSSYYFLNTPIDWNSSAGTWIVHNIPLYTVNTTSGVGEFLFAVQNSAGAQLPAWVQIYEYNPNMGQYDLVNYIETSSQGETPVILQNGQLYSFNVYNNNGALVTSLNNQVLACTSATGCAEIITVNSNLYQYSAPKATCSAQSSAITCGVSSGSSGAIAYQLTVASSGIAGTEEYCSQVLNSPNGQISCSLPSGTYIWQLTYESANGQILPLAGNGNAPVTSSLFGSIGLIIGFFGVLLLVLLATWSPTVSVIILVIATALFSGMGLFAFTMEDIGGLIILTILYLWRYRQ